MISAILRQMLNERATTTIPGAQWQVSRAAYAPHDQLDAVDVDPREQIAIGRRRLEHGIVLAVSGEIDLATAPTLEHELLRAEQTDAVVAIDLTNVSFMDSTGLHMIMDANLRLRERGGRLIIVQGPPQIRRLFELTGLSDHLDLVPDDTDLARFGGSGNQSRSCLRTV